MYSREKLQRAFRQARWLKVSQLFWFVIHRLTPRRCPAEVIAGEVRKSIRAHEYPRVCQPDSPEFSFLNISKPAIEEGIEWLPRDVSRLWRYNLHYFDYLRWDVFSPELKSRLISEWIRDNPTGTEDAWEPCAVSVRVLNWVKYFDSLDEAVSHEWLGSLLNQANWLTANLEYDILANHYLKNGMALLYAGSYFTGPVADKLLRRGLAIVDAEVTEQILSDGGHYERSLMYHSIVLEDLLDVVNISLANPGLLPVDFVRRVTEKSLAATRFLEDMLGADGNIPLFNDGALGITPLPEELIAYCQRVAEYERAPKPPGAVKIVKPTTGYYGYRAGGDSLIIDCGDIAPDYQPGHAHCDLLSYELCVDGNPLVVDTGTCTYEDNDKRQYLRSTAAHNTVEVEGQDQTEFWGRFRVGRRARPTLACIGRFDETGMTFTGGHTGYRFLPQKVLHERQVDVEFSGVWSVHDALSGNGSCKARSFIHFAPGIKLTNEADGSWLARSNCGTAIRITIGQGCSALLLATEYYPEFGVCEAKSTLVLEKVAKLPFVMNYSLEKMPQDMLT
jgi:uncharacterized heparinase superfamily protein